MSLRSFLYENVPETILKINFGINWDFAMFVNGRLTQSEGDTVKLLLYQTAPNFCSFSVSKLKLSIQSNEKTIHVRLTYKTGS